MEKLIVILFIVLTTFSACKVHKGTQISTHEVSPEISRLIKSLVGVNFELHSIEYESQVDSRMNLVKGNYKYIIHGSAVSPVMDFFRLELEVIGEYPEINITGIFRLSYEKNSISKEELIGYIDDGFVSRFYISTKNDQLVKVKKFGNEKTMSWEVDSPLSGGVYFQMNSIGDSSGMDIYGESNGNRIYQHRNGEICGEIILEGKDGKRKRYYRSCEIIPFVSKLDSMSGVVNLLNPFFGNINYNQLDSLQRYYFQEDFKKFNQSKNDTIFLKPVSILK
jgi:hypothetical protein